MKRIEEFTQNGKNFVFIDFSGLASDEEFMELINSAAPAIAKYPVNSVYTITNITNLRFDSHRKEIAIKYMAQNKPYVRRGAFIGLDGIKKMMIKAIMKLSGRTNMYFTFTKEQAVEWLLQHG